MATVTEKQPREFVRVFAENYISPDFLKKENEHLWPRVWQVACREEEIPNPGDFHVYDIANETILVIRNREGGLNAFFNVCPHRGRQIMVGTGHAANLRCNYHNWTFDLEGKNVVLQDKQDYSDFLDKECIDLTRVQVDTWGGFVFVNIDPTREPLREYLGAVCTFLDPFEYEAMRYRWALELHVDCNWKVALEAFMEGYHVAATHTQLLDMAGEDYTQSYAHGLHSHFGYWTSQTPIGQPSPRLKKGTRADARAGLIDFFTHMEEEFGAIFTDRDYQAVKDNILQLAEDTDPMTAMMHVIELGRKAAEEEGCGYPANLTGEAMYAAGTGWNVFPNCVTLPYFDGAVWYRSRPHPSDPDKCVFNIYSLKRYAPGKEPGARVEVHTDITGKSFGMIVDQDVANMGLVQKGMKSRGFTYARPNPVQEVEITNMHKHIEEYVLGQRRGL